MTTDMTTNVTSSCAQLEDGDWPGRAAGAPFRSDLRGAHPVGAEDLRGVPDRTDHHGGHRRHQHAPHVDLRDHVVPSSPRAVLAGVDAGRTTWTGVYGGGCDPGRNPHTPPLTLTQRQPIRWGDRDERGTAWTGPSSRSPHWRAPPAAPCDTTTASSCSRPPASPRTATAITTPGPSIGCNASCCCASSGWACRPFPRSWTGPSTPPMPWAPTCSG